MGAGGGVLLCGEGGQGLERQENVAENTCAGEKTCAIMKES